MKILAIIIIALLVGTGLIGLAAYEPGFVLLQYGSWSLETSLIVFVVMFLLLLVGGYYVLKSLGFLRQMPRQFKQWRQTQRQRRASRALIRGLIALEEGRWSDAERLLIRSAPLSDAPLLHYLAAARAAQKQQAYDRRDNYLRLAHETTEEADIAVGVVQAELQLAADQKEQALATLQHLRDIAPKHPYVLQLLQHVYRDMNEWQNIQNVLPDLRKQHVLDSQSVEDLKAETWLAQLQSALEQQDWQKMSEIWQSIPSKKRQTATLLKPYVAGLVQQGGIEEALTLIAQCLQHDWSDALVYQYGKIESDEPMQQLARAEKWLKLHPDNSWLLLTLGRLAWRCKLWAKAEGYLQSCIAHGGNGEAYYLLVDVLNKQGEQARATQICEQGLLNMLEQAPEPV